MVSSWVHDGDLVARVGKHKLYSAEVAAYIPDGISAEDSAAVAVQYIEKWASDLMFMELASQELSKSEKDVSREIEEYRRALLKYRYEQKYVNQRLDTLVTHAQIQAYFEAHPDHFVLDMPIVKVRLLRIAHDSPNLAVIRSKMSSDKTSDLIEADSLAFSSALRYTDFGGRWIDVTTLARELSMDYGRIFQNLKPGFMEMEDGHGNVDIVYVYDMMRSGEAGPVSYYQEMIRDILLSARKQALLQALEQELLEKARVQENFEIY